MASKALVLDANILIRAVLGNRVRLLLEQYSDRISFIVPDAALAEAERHLAVLVVKRGGDPASALAMLQAIVGLTDLASTDSYGHHETEARRRLGTRDPDDWPILACAMAFGCPIWTEDTDFFGTGVATWTSTAVEIFLNG